MLQPQEALKKLMDGNTRFVQNRSLHPNRCQETKNNLLEAQNPFAVVLACSDSRVPIEIVFDVGFGDIFVVRTAGHVLSKEVLGSIEYAIQHLGAKLLLVLGHDNCGAIKSAINAYNDNPHYEISENMQSILNHICPVIKNSDIPHEHPNYTDEIIKANVIYQVNDLIQKDKYIFDKVNSCEIGIVGAIYNLKDSTIKILTKKGIK